MQDYKKILAWQKAHNLVKYIYEYTSAFPVEETYGITAQLRRSALSIPTNIAEGSGKEGQRDFARFLQIAMGSASETEYLLLVSFELGYITEEAYMKLNESTVEVKKLLGGFLKKVRITG